MEKGKESSDSIYKREIDILSSGRLKLTEKNFRLQEIISKKDNEIADLSAKRLNGNIPPPPMNDSSQKLPGWVSDDLRPSSIITVLKIKLWSSIKVLPEKIY